jgi:ADP-heptose:LPS heptosyltransferase
MSVPWGATPLVYDDTPENKRIEELSRKFDPNNFKADNFDASVQVTIPNEFMKLASKNICITAGIEVDRVAPVWISKTNEMADVLIVPSVHAASTFVNTKYQTQTGEAIELNKPVHVVPDWINTAVFNTNPVQQDDRFVYPSKFNFIAMGLGLDRGEGHDRKNFHQLIRWFCEQFKDNEDVGLVLKLSMVNNSSIDFRNVAGRIQSIKAQAGCGQFPRIHLIHGRLSNEELAALFKSKSIHAFLTLTHGEGYGLPILEAAACGLPVVATDWSGHLDFLTKDGKKLFVPISCEINDIAQESVWKDVYEPGSKWAWPIEKDAKVKMAKVVVSYEKPKQWATELAEVVGKNFGEKAENDFVVLFEKLLSGEVVKPTQITQSNTNSSNQFVSSIENLKFRQAVSGKKTLLFTMPQSAGDVFVSTGTIASLRKKFPDHFIKFATTPQFFSILVGNKDIDEVIPFEDWMMNVLVDEFVFDDVFTPNLDIQLTTSNWIHGGKGRRLAEEIASRCDVELGTPTIKTVKPLKAAQLPEKYIAFHPAAASGKWSARGYHKWAEVMKLINHDIPIVQIGMPDEPLVEGVDIDFRGKHVGYNQFAWLVKNSSGLLGVDTFSMHLADWFDVPMLTIFGSTYSTKTGPVNRSKSLQILIDTPDRNWCSKACYKDQCFIDNSNPCVNKITPEQIAEQFAKIISQ